MNAVLALAVLLPLLACLARGVRLQSLLLIAAPLPLLLLAVVGEGGVSVSWLLLGFSLAVDEGNRALLLLAGLGWSLAGAYAGGAVEERRRGFVGFWMLTLGGQALALLGADPASFYLGYVLMTLAAYGLIVHARSDEAWRAGRVYLVLALLGEAAVLSGLLILLGTWGNVSFAELQGLGVPGVAAGLMALGFAVKLGAVPLHVWLPLAHPVAPVPASAVLSGVLVKAGLLGLLRFVPAAPDLVPLLLGAGLFTAAYGALVGLCQSRLKTVLAYSTVSQMGLMMAGFAAVLSGADRGAAVAVLGLFALHHGLNKIALFLAAGHRLASPLAHALFLLPAAALAGLPMSSGHLAKLALKGSLGLAGADAWLIGLSLSSVLTTLLLLHAWRLAGAQAKGRSTPHPAWLLAVAAGLLLPWWWGAGFASEAWSATALFDALWPPLLGLLLHLAWRRWLRAPCLALPEGDIVILMEHTLRSLRPVLDRLASRWMALDPSLPDALPKRGTLRRMEIAFARMPVAGLLMLLLLLGLTRGSV